MKKLLAIMLVLALSITMFAACGDKTPAADPVNPVTEPAVDTATEPETPAEVTVDDVAASGARTGIAVVTSIASSKSAEGEEEGLAQTDATVVAVLLDENDVIVDVAIDTAQSKIGFNAEGKLTNDINTIFQTKHEQGEAYGMRVASGIGKEWFEQADALAAFVIGKTASQLSGVAIDDGYPTDADLAAGVTMNVNNYLNAIIKASETAKPLGASIGDQVGVGTLTHMSDSVDASPDADGLARAYSTFVAVTVDAAGTVTSAAVDSVQGDVNFNIAGEVSTIDVTIPLESKQELGDGYGMRVASGIGKEWFEQADAFAAYLVGKNVSDIAGIALTDGVPTDADLAASVTMSVDNINIAAIKAITNALLAPAEATDSIEGVAELPAA